MQLDALLHANFKLLDDAVTDWSTLVDRLDELKKDAEDGLHQAANKANWAGMNAQVSKEFIGKTAGEFADAHTQAKTIHSILSDTRGELKGYHRQLTEAIDRGRKKSLKVIGYKGGFTVTSDVPPEGRVKADSDNQADLTALRDEVQGILDKASQSDDSASTVLKAIADQSTLGFSDANYSDRDSAAAAVKAAKELAKLAKKDPDDLTVKDFDRLNDGLKKYANDGLFGETFATTLGPKKTLEFWTGVTDANRGNFELGHKRLEQFDDLQRNLGTTLAHASQSDTLAMTEWKRQMIDIGDKPIYGTSGGPMGFQVMSNLMRTGDYDDQFLHDYGTKLMETERKFTGNGEHGNGAWQHMGGSPWLNRIGEDSGSDPLTGYLKGLSNSPDAATDFFNQQYVSKDDPDNPFEWDSDDEDEYMAKKELSNFQYLFEERDWPQEASSTGDELNTGKNNLALALEAATTGHPAGELPTADTPAHNGEQTKLFESLVSSISNDGGRLTDSGYMSDSIGQITSEYLPDINRAMTDDSDGDTNKLFPVSGSSATLNHRDVNALLIAVGQNPEGYAAVEVANKSYMASLMDYHMNPDLAASDRYSKDTQFAIEQLAHGSGEVSGTLAIGRQEAVAGPADEDDKAYDHSVTQWKNGVSGVIGTGIGVGATFVASPIAGAAAGGVASTVSSLVLEELFKNAEGHAKEDAGSVMGENWESGLEENAAYTERAAELAAKAHGRTDLQDISVDEKARTAAQQGFRDAGTNTEYMAPHLKTDI
ncbi:hypothetical protein [Streptomyces europaeiscabiei]|uniref:hypothetical protein n=1 Tax=Streptomyces europaeiscabiei TaxID=146819 RepID=UPI0029AE757C|nr:hypothetical protein [Streptomyces europaeiscabiei]MDX3714326.1 hypothetical protein [Streptomyces europaeiscabiei]MDX3865544.1 hypothetical protein [Streptomyces europaeiscabiei]MDX3875007.1 hypothetical protein [Streptomyces europaeiscabiei]